MQGPSKKHFCKMLLRGKQEKTTQIRNNRIASLRVSAGCWAEEREDHFSELLLYIRVCVNKHFLSMHNPCFTLLACA